MEIILPSGVRIGNVDDEFTGVTAIVFDDGCVCGCDVRGGAPGTRETALLATEKANDHVDAILLCGGSAYGLEAACGAMNALRENGKGVKVLDSVVPIVPAAVIFDLNRGYHYPDMKMGYEAVNSAARELKSGSVGAGKGATVGKILGIEHCSKTGLGAFEVDVDGARVIAVMVVNALGDVVKDGKVVAGAKLGDTFVNTESLICDSGASGSEGSGSSGGSNGSDSSEGSNGTAKINARKFRGANTTIGCIITDAILTKSEANKLASIAHNGLARSIYPVHTDLDGDTIFCASVGKKKVDLLKLEVAVVRAVQNAVYGAVV